MLRHLPVLSLLLVACGTAPPPEPKVVERVVYVQAPCDAPVIVERQPPRRRSRPPFVVKGAPYRGPSVGVSRQRHRVCEQKKSPAARARCRDRIARREGRHR